MRIERLTLIAVKKNADTILGPPLPVLVSAHRRYGGDGNGRTEFEGGSSGERHEGSEGGLESIGPWGDASCEVDRGRDAVAVSEQEALKRAEMISNQVLASDDGYTLYLCLISPEIVGFRA